ncbi:hypothetical protein KPH14_002641 [Odynerus spinipes]|uniref:Transposase n=1 Tax=Odynerus spinipes TaxID=1348599 RepID=A0AAD9RGV0_9HYME|nr:hypothetical protein KPH14_002641 [Odynerus spinipes]
MLCEATSGYICNFKVYSGTPGRLQDTVLSILRPYMGFHHHIYMDNYYNSVNTAELLLQNSTRICGTVRSNRGLPQNLKNIRLNEHETKFARKGQVLLHLWQAKKKPTSKNHFNHSLSRNVARALIETHEMQHSSTEEAEPSNAIERTRRAPRYDPPERISQDFKKHRLVPIVTNGKKAYPHRACRQELSLDEGIIPWRGRLSFRTNNPAKLVKYGILVRMLCEATSGYICNFKVYSGTPGRLQDTVLSILRPYMGFHHHIYMDNYYNSVNTAELLLQNSTRICGTVRSNRGLPQNLKNIRLNEHETKFARKGQVLLHLWQAKKKPTSKNHFNHSLSRNVARALIETHEMQHSSTEEAEPSNAIERTRRAPRYDPPERISQDFKKHRLVPIVTNGKKAYPHRACRVCSANKKTGYTRYVCEYCNVPLHKLACFERYHTVNKY